jgi:hypothetical protein
MDVPLYAIGLILFAVLYLAVGVFLGFVLIITLLMMLLYVAVRYGKLPDNYPHGPGDIMITVIFIGVTWGIFVFLGPKNPIPFLPTPGQGLTYGVTAVNLVPYVAIGLVLAVIFLLIGAFVASQFRDLLTRGGAGTGGGGGDPGKPKQGVGA